MLLELYKLSYNFLRNYNRPYLRYFLINNKLENRFSILKGQRGVGKSTISIQYLLGAYRNDYSSEKIIYIQADHFTVTKYSLYEIAEEFYNKGGEIICFDEIHKYPNWSLELKSIYDTFTSLKIIASGSSALEIEKGSHDLSRRAIIYNIHGMSFREYIELKLDLRLDSYNLETIIKYHRKIAAEIINVLSIKKTKILYMFDNYLNHGYYPYFTEYNDKSLYHLILEQNIHTAIEADLTAIYPQLSGSSIRKIKKLLSTITNLVPYTPDISKMKNILEIGDARTLKTYLYYLEKAGIILQFQKSGKSLRQLKKPEKIYLNNSNQIYALSSLKENTGTIRETFFVNILNCNHKVSIPKKGDFIIDEEYLFEIGGKNKSFSQIKDQKNSYLGVDRIEIGYENKIPLWLFGFLY